MSIKNIQEVRWGIIGCGNVTEIKSGPAFSMVPHSNLVAVMRRDAEKAKDYATRHGVSYWYNDASKLIEDENVNAVYIATPPDSHAYYAIQAMKAGKPVYVEKPMASSYKECQAMNTIAAQTGVPLFVAYYRRSLPYFQKVKELLDKKIIGNILMVHCKLITTASADDHNKNQLPWRVKPEISGGGYFYDLSCHTLDMLDYLFGPLYEVKGTFANRAELYHAEDVVAASFKMGNGIPGSGTWCFSANENSRTDFIEIIGSHGRIVFSTFDFSPILLETGQIKQDFPIEKPKHIQQDLICQIVNELRGESTSPSDGISGSRTNFVMDIILGKIDYN